MVIVVPVSEEEAESGTWYSRGMPLRFTFRGSTVHVFDKETGHNLEHLPPKEPAAVKKVSLEKPPANKEFSEIGDPFAED